MHQVGCLLCRLSFTGTYLAVGYVGEKGGGVGGGAKGRRQGSDDS